ncbi:MAG: hypothetical protein ACK5MV_00110 [Aminipila sp.]
MGKRCIVNQDGVIEAELQEGDRIVRKKSVEFLESKMTVHYDNYGTYNADELKLVLKELDKNEKVILMSLLPYVQFSTCLICHVNGRGIGTEDMIDITGLGRNLVYDTLNSLVKKDIVYRGKNSREVQYFMNPFIARKGKMVDKVLATMFRNYHVRSLGCKVKNLGLC